MKIDTIGMQIFTDEDGTLLAVTHLQDRHHVFYQTIEMGEEEIANLFKADYRKVEVADTDE